MPKEAPYRIVGDILTQTETLPPTTTNELNPEPKMHISYAKNKTTSLENVAIIQACQQLTPEIPYFYAEVQNCDPKAIISIGIAPINIDRHAGQYNNSLGYHNNTGRVYTSWKTHANTLGLQYGKGSTIGIYVTYFGKRYSTVLVYYNNFPIATRYHFEEDKERYFPTITFSGGQVDVSVVWPHAIERLPDLNAIPVSQWIRTPMSSYDPTTGIFENCTKAEDLPIQSPVPLSKSFPCFIVTQEEVSPVDGKGASVGLATCSPLKPTPTCSLMKDYYTWFAKMRIRTGNTIGWGIFYDETCEDDKAEQLCLVFILFNNVIVDSLFVLQPEGGFVPIVLLQPYATKVSIERRDLLTGDEYQKLRGLYRQKLGAATLVYQQDQLDRELSEKSFRKSEQVLLNISENLFRVSVPKTENTVHFIQFCRSLTYERRFFFVEIETLSSDGQITVGIASSDLDFNVAPGIGRDTVGYHSYSGKLYSNRKDTGNMPGHKCKQGDTIGVEISISNKQMSVVLFSRNFRPIGTRYLTLNDHSQFFPTILIESANDPVELIVYWQTRVSIPPTYNMRNPEDWCLPTGATVDLKEKTFNLPPHFDHSLCIQAPYSLYKKNNHFGIVLFDEFSDTDPPPAIALCTASPLDPPPTSNYKQDYLRFWPIGEAAKYIQHGDRIGWGIYYPEGEDAVFGENKEQLIICYLTVNRTVSHVRVLCQPVGGFYPIVIAPPNVNRIKMDFTSTRLATDEFTPEQIKAMLAEARAQLELEESLNPSVKVTEPHNNPPTETPNHLPVETYIHKPVEEFNNHPVETTKEDQDDADSAEYDDYQDEPDDGPAKSRSCIII